MLPAHRARPVHALGDECVLHCLEGRVDVEWPGGARALQAGDLLLVPAGQAHGLHAREDSALLVTLRLHDGTAASGRVEP